jgi:hypothetical protein
LPAGHEATPPVDGLVGGVVGGGVVTVVGAGVVEAVGGGTTGAVGWWSAEGGTAVAAGTLVVSLVVLATVACFASRFCLSFVSAPIANPAPTPIARTARIPAAIHARVPGARR